MRIALHILGAVAAAIAGGTVVFQGIPTPWDSNILALAALVGIASNVWLGATSTGVSLPLSGARRDTGKRAVERAEKRWLGN